MVTSEPLEDLAARVIATCRERALTIVTAESCTGGLVAGALTGIAGASHVFDRGFVTYSNAAKMEMLGVTEALIARHGAVSEAVARAMAEGALDNSPAGIAVSVTGIAGPGGGTPDKPVGLVHFAAARRRLGARHERVEFGDIGRTAVRSAAVEHALRMLLRAAEAEG